MTAGNSPPFAQFREQQFLNLETFRRSGVAVRTPVWFVEDKDRLFVRTQADSGKVKRIHREPRVRVVPSDAQGNPKGGWIEARAHLAPADQAQRARQLFRKKYGLQLRGFETMMKLRRGTWATVRIEPLDASEPGVSER